MSLLKTFPEIDIFFSSKRFTDSDLNSFLKSIDEKYTDKGLRKSALTLIKLEMLKYDINKDELVLAEFEKSKIQKNKIVSEKSTNNFNKVDKLANLKIEFIAENLNWSFQYLQRLLAQKNIVKVMGDNLNKEEFALIKEMLNSRLIAIKRNKRKQEQEKEALNNSKSISKPLVYTDDVYGKIAWFGLGKVIYIRRS
jgi:hypothetical protein